MSFEAGNCNNFWWLCHQTPKGIRAPITVVEIFIGMKSKLGDFTTCTFRLISRRYSGDTGAISAYFGSHLVELVHGCGVPISLSLSLYVVIVLLALTSIYSRDCPCDVQSSLPFLGSSFEKIDWVFGAGDHSPASRRHPLDLLQACVHPLKIN
jgi:hypothetical protein